MRADEVDQKTQKGRGGRREKGEAKWRATRIKLIILIKKIRNPELRHRAQANLYPTDF